MEKDITGQESNPSRQTLETFYNNYITTANKSFDHPTAESITKYKEFFSPELVVRQFMPSSLGEDITLNR